MAVTVLHCTVLQSLKMVQSLIPIKMIIFAGSRILVYSFQRVIRKMEPS